MKKTLYKLNKLIIISLLLTSLQAKEKYLLLTQGNEWLPMMSQNLINNHDTIKNLPFSGFIMVGNTFTHEVMKPKTKLDYQTVWNEVKGLKDLYRDKHNFLRIDIHFPADYWDYVAWEQVTKNFAIVAQVAADLNFEGIVFDDEIYEDINDYKMVNFKFPTKNELNEHSTAWERKGSQEKAIFDKHAYRNPKYTFKEHSDKITSLFKEIMRSMVEVNPNLTVLVYNGPALSHPNSNKDNRLIVNLGSPRLHEHIGAIFTGFKEGLEKNATLYDMGESYRYREKGHFQNSYQWRKYNIAKDEYNNDLDNSYQWLVPSQDRASWSKDVNVGFMVFNKGQKSMFPEFDTRHRSTINDIKATLQKALKYSDKYAIYYTEEQDWLRPNTPYPLTEGWMKMMQEVYKNK